MSEKAAETEKVDDRAFRKRLTTVFGWIAGGSLGLLLNYLAIILVADERYPTVPTTFVLFVLGAFGGMALADRGGERAFRPLGIAAGVLLATFLTLVVLALMSPTP